MRGLVLALALLLVVSGRAAAVELPVVVVGDAVTVRAEAGLEHQAQKLADHADRDLAEIEADLPGLPQVGHVEVRLVKHMEEIADAAPGDEGAPPWAVGTAYPDQGVVVVAMRGRDGDVIDPGHTLAHELAHMALDQALGRGRVPRWLTEGFAYLHASEFSMGRAETLMGAIVGDKLIPLAQLDDAFPEREDEASLAYAESYDFVAFLAHRGRASDHRDEGDRGAFRDFLRNLARGESPGAAARDAYSADLATLEAEWQQDLRSRYLWYPIGLGSLLLWGGGAVLLVLGWLRRRRLDKRRLAQWEAEENARDHALGDPHLL